MDCTTLERPAAQTSETAEPELQAGQLDLFAWLPFRVMPAGAPAKRNTRRRKPKRKKAVQLAIEFRHPDDIPEDGDFPAQRVVDAAGCRPPETRAFRSVWDLAAAPANPAKRPSLRMERAQADTRQILRRIERDGQGTRHFAVREQETEEWREKEERRRARQRPPKPNKQARGKFKMKNSVQFNDAGEQ